MVHSNPNIDLVSDNGYTKFAFNSVHSFLRYVAKTKVLRKSRAITVVNLPKIYITNVDLVNDNVYTKFGLNLSIRSQDMEQKPNSDVNQGPLLCCKFAKNNDLQHQRRSCQ